MAFRGQKQEGRNWPEIRTKPADLRVNLSFNASILMKPGWFSRYCPSGVRGRAGAGPWNWYGRFLAKVGSVMNKLFLAAVAALGLAGAAQAATYTVFVTATPYRTPGSDGLQTRAIVLDPAGPQNFDGASYDIALNAMGDSVTRAVYGLVAYDAPIDPDDLLPRPTLASFDFGGYGKQTITGESYAKATGPAGSGKGFAIAEFFGQSLRFGVGGGAAILVQLSDTVFGRDTGDDFVMGRRGAGFVQATFTLVPAPVPLPATLPLGLAGMALLGGLAARRRRA